MPTIKEMQKTIDDLAMKFDASVKRERKFQKEISEKEKEISGMIADQELYARAKVLLDQLVRAAETGDITAIEQTSGAGREFIDTYR